MVLGSRRGHRRFSFCPWQGDEFPSANGITTEGSIVAEGGNIPTHPGVHRRVEVSPEGDCAGSRKTCSAALELCIGAAGPVNRSILELFP